jgi:hypothetical protein
MEDDDMKEIIPFQQAFSQVFTNSMKQSYNVALQIKGSM